MARLERRPADVYGLPRRQAVAALVLGVLVSALLVTLISTGLIAVIRRLV